MNEQDALLALSLQQEELLLVSGVGGPGRPIDSSRNPKPGLPGSNTRPIPGSGALGQDQDDVEIVKVSAPAGVARERQRMRQAAHGVLSSAQVAHALRTVTAPPGLTLFEAVPEQVLPASPVANMCDPSLELSDPNPDLHATFLELNRRLFGGVLSSCEVCWSKRMTSCAGICYYQGGGYIRIALSQPLLSLRPRSDFVNTLIHECLHAWNFKRFGVRNRDGPTGHGPRWKAAARACNRILGTNVTEFHTFGEEVRQFQQHHWRCDGPCRGWSRFYYGYVRRAMNRPPGPYDRWFARHQKECGGTFVKIKEPEGYGKKKKGKGKGKGEGGAASSGHAGTGSTSGPQSGPMDRFLGKGRSLAGGGAGASSSGAAAGGPAASAVPPSLPTRASGSSSGPGSSGPGHTASSVVDLTSDDPPAPPRAGSSSPSSASAGKKKRKKLVQPRLQHVVGSGIPGLPASPDLLAEAVPAGKRKRRRPSSPPSVKPSSSSSSSSLPPPSSSSSSSSSGGNTVSPKKHATIEILSDSDEDSFSSGIASDDKAAKTGSTGEDPRLGHGSSSSPKRRRTDASASGAGIGSGGQVSGSSASGGDLAGAGSQRVRDARRADFLAQFEARLKASRGAGSMLEGTGASGGAPKDPLDEDEDEDEAEESSGSKGASPPSAGVAGGSSLAERASSQGLSLEEAAEIEGVLDGGVGPGGGQGAGMDPGEGVSSSGAGSSRGAGFEGGPADAPDAALRLCPVCQQIVPRGQDMAVHVDRCVSMVVDIESSDEDEDEDEY